MNITKQTARFAAIPAVLATLLTGAVAAHAGEKTLVGQVPFEFTVGEKVFPAGEYVFELDRVAPGTVLVRSADSSRSAIALAAPAGDAATKGEPAMMFNVYGQRSFISSIRMSKSTAVSLKQGAQERSLANAGTQATVALIYPTAAAHAAGY